jgi:ribosome biogenesis protein BMS1
MQLVPLQHGFPKVMGVLTHLDEFHDPKKLKKQKKTLKARFWSEIYNGAKLFYLSGMQHGRYNKRDTLNLARFIATAKFRPLTWRTTHPYVVGDRFEDITPPGRVHDNPNVERDVAVYGWLHGCNLKPGQLVHVAGVGVGLHKATHKLESAWFQPLNQKDVCLTCQACI